MNPKLILYLLLLNVGGYLSAQDTIRLTDYLRRYNGDFSLATYRALEACRAYDQSVLLIPPGRHNYYPEYAHERWVKMSNNINGRKRIAFPIVNQRQLKIAGQNAEIVLHGVMMGMVIHGSEGVTVEGISFDWDRPYYLEGEVVAVDREHHFYELSINPEENFSIQNNDLVIHRPEGNYFIGGNYWFDPITRAPVYLLERRKGRGWNPYKKEHYRLERLGDSQRIRVYNTVDSLPKIGWRLVAKWRNQPNVNRVAPAIHLQESISVRLENCRIHSAAGMGVIGERCEDVTLKQVEVSPNPDTDRIVSTTADATHFINCRGWITLEECFFEGCLDDGLNVHGNYATVRRRLNDTTLLAEIVHIQQKGYVFAARGDSLRLVEPASLLPHSSVRVVRNVEQLNDAMWVITTNEPWPENIDGFGLENTSWVANLRVSRTTVHRNWARGLLFKTAGRVVIEDNYLSPSMSALRNWGEMRFFNESGSVQDVNIRRNTMVDVCRVGNGQPAIVIFPQIKDTLGMGHQGFYNQNIRIRKNTLLTFDRGWLLAQSVDGLELSDNYFGQTDTYPAIFPEKPALEFRKVNDLLIKGNRVETSWQPLMKIDPFSRKRATINDQAWSYR